jgi:hypothetical protein
MVSALLALHPLDTHSLCPDSLLDFWFDSNLEFSMDFLGFTFLQMFHLLPSGPFNLIFEHLQDSFDEDSTSSLSL